jgi:16S rRNA (cytidine1402-2'-O)-methyltransferase
VACLYLIPTPLGDTPLDWVLPEETLRVTRRLDYFIVEQAKSARAFLKRVGTVIPLQALELRELNEHTPAEALEHLLKPLLDGRDAGLLSEAGCPAVADPGSDLTRLAHRHGVRVEPLVGPSSILLALMASGLVGQRFSFHGYLPAKADERDQTLKELERRAMREHATQVFIETPYRNRAMFDALLRVCHDTTWLCLARGLTTEDELIISQPISAWRRQAVPDIERRPCVFLIAQA